MSLRNTNELATIICDKCGKEQTEKHGEHNIKFFNSGWTVNPRAKKYVHLCYDCKPPAQRRSTDFVIEKFGSRL